MINQQFTLHTNHEYIDITDENNQNYWTERLGVSIETLKSAIRACKSMVFVNVSEYLKKIGKLAN